MVLESQESGDFAIRIAQLLRHVLLHVSVHQRNMRWIRMVIATIGVPSMDIVEKRILTKEMELIVEAVQENGVNGEHGRNVLKLVGLETNSERDHVKMETTAHLMVINKKIENATLNHVDVQLKQEFGLLKKATKLDIWK